MARYINAEESLKEYISLMGDSLGKLFHALWQEVAWLYMKWGEYMTLFGTKPSRIDLMNKVAPHFFRIVQDSLWEDTILHIARLTDPPQSMGKENLSIQRLPLLVADENLKQNLKDKIAIAITSSEFCRDWRNRRIAHKDLKLAIEDGITPLQPASREAIKKSLSSIADVLNLITLHYQNSTALFDQPGGYGGGEELLYCIDNGLKFDEGRRARIESGKFTESDLKSRDI